jgi:hypothetical protein
MSRFLESINRQVVPPDLMADVVKLHNELQPDDRRDLTEQILCIIKAAFAVETAEDRGRLGSSIMFRLEALAKFLSRESGHKLAIAGRDGVVRVPWELVVAAAQEPLVEGPDGRPEFVELNLLDRFLESKVPVGTA